PPRHPPPQQKSTPPTLLSPPPPHRRGGQSDRIHVEPIVEIHSKSSPLNRLHQITVCRGNHSNIDLDRLAAPQPLKLPLLQYPQQLGLKLQRQISHLVQKNRPSIRQLKPPHLPPRRPRKRSLLVPEQLALDQLPRQRRTVHFHQRPLSPPTLPMHRSRHQLFPRPRLSQYQNRHVRLSHLIHLLKNLLDTLT